MLRRWANGSEGKACAIDDIVRLRRQGSLTRDDGTVLAQAVGRAFEDGFDIGVKARRSEGEQESLFG